MSNFDPVIEMCEMVTSGYTVFIDNGELRIRVPGSCYPDPFLNLTENLREQFEWVICGRLNRACFKFSYHTAGKLGAGRFDGISLQLINFVTGETNHIEFNANIKRQRTTKYGKSGSMLPKGHFHVGKLSSFAIFWRYTLGLPLPSKLSTFHEKMHMLKPIILTGYVDDCGKLHKDTVKPLELNSVQIKELFLG